ncbi:MAG: hypothetical protein L0H73_15500 [Nitrococcus sp.]|nr:hypothetical protein [Nitrococcus sp.]
MEARAREKSIENARRRMAEQRDALTGTHYPRPAQPKTPAQDVGRSLEDENIT